MARANLAGSLYYTRYRNTNDSTRTADVMRIRPGVGLDTFLSQATTGICHSCHSVSANGQRMVSSHGEFDQPFQTTDITTGQMLHQGSGRSRFQAISPNGEFILWGQTSQSFLKLSRSTSHDVVGQLEVQSPLRPANPVWSPDGKHVAFAAYDSTVSGNGETDYTSSALWVADVDWKGAIVDDITGWHAASSIEDCRRRRSAKR